MKRRALLKLLGLSAACAGLGSSKLANVLAAGGQDGPCRRLIVISHCHGWPYDSWKMRPNGLSEATPWQADLSSLAVTDFSQSLAPLHAHRQRLLPLDGLSLATAELDVDGNRHDTGWVHAWTGNWADFSGADTNAWSASLDQLVAEQIARSDRLPSLEISVDDVAEPGRPISYAFNGSPLPAESAPDRVWQRLFGPSVAGDPLALRQRAVLEFAYGEYKELVPKLGALQRDKLDAHFELVHRLGERLEGMATLECGPVPELHMPGTLATYEQRFDAMSELIGAAFSCDITRVVSLSLGEIPTADFGWDFLTDDVHKGLAHEIYNDPQKHEAMTDYVTMHAEQVARLVALLESLPDGDGGSVMDNTLIVWGSELANGWHGYQHYCPVLIGGSWQFDTGRYLYWPHETPTQVLTPVGYSTVAGSPHQQMLVSVAQAMGLSADHVGIEHVQSQTGERIECTGPLPNLT